MVRLKGGPVIRGFRAVGIGFQYPEAAFKAIFEAMPNFVDIDIEMDEMTYECAQERLKLDPPDSRGGVAQWKGMRIFLIEEGHTWKEFAG